MATIRINTSARIPLFLTNSGAGASGLGTADFKSGVVTIIRADGTTVDITLVASGAGQNFYEISSSKAPGLYHIVVPGADLAVQGPTVLAATPAATAFSGTVANFSVDAYPTSIDNMNDATFGKWQIVVSGADANKLVLYRSDGVTVLAKFALADAAGDSTFVDPFSRTPTS
jgi:hypothetical protein